MLRTTLVAAGVLCCLACGSSALAGDNGRRAGGDQTVEAMRFVILNADDGQVIGHATYHSEQVNDRIVVWGENRYKNGEHDVERDELSYLHGDRIPTMLHFEHRFFNADGSLKLMGRADPQSGEASCESYAAGQEHKESKKLDFPTDAYAGAAAVIAMKRAFLNGRDSIDFHVFDCAPGPVLASVNAERADDNQHWAPYPKPLTRVELSASLGMLSKVLGSLLPSRNVWFDPSDGWQYVGGRIQRYLAGGPQVILVREGSAAAYGFAERHR
ncbi:MAG TPA: hypothetical protein VKT27_05105 [Candidatus Binataceae bacterium]|nr:hypothetical protein [Candidatus Binataceae bacterium]